MAESDAAGPRSSGGRNPRILSREDADRLLVEAEREWDLLTPEEKARIRAAEEKAAQEARERYFRAYPSEIAAPIDQTVFVDSILARMEFARAPTAADIQTAAAEAAKKILAESRKDRKPRGDTTCERLRDLHLNIDPEFAETATIRKLAKRIERSTGAIDGSTYYQTKLKPIREDIAGRKKAVKAAQKWGDFNSAGRLDEANEDH